jgi:hypothetical protein
MATRLVNHLRNGGHMDQLDQGVDVRLEYIYKNGSLR